MARNQRHEHPGLARFDRFRAAIRQLAQGWPRGLSLLLMTLTLGVAFRCIERAEWVSPHPSLLLTLVASVAVSVLALRLKPWLGLSLTLVAGLVMVTAQFLALLPSAGPEAGLNGLMASLGRVPVYLRDTNGIVALVFLVFAWTAGALSCRALLLKANPWPTVLIGAVGILFDLRYVTEAFYSYFVFFVLLSLLLVGQTHFASYVSARHSLKRVTLKLAATAISVVAALSIIIVSVAWMLPEIRATGVQAAIGSSMSWADKIADSGINVFSSVAAKQTMVTSAEQDTLVFGGNDERGHDVQFVVSTTKRPNYFRTRRYDIYNQWGWTSSPLSGSPLAGGAAATGSVPAARTTPFSFKVTDKVRTDLVIVAGELKSSGSDLTLQRLPNGEIGSVTSPRMMDYGESYVIDSVLNAATPAELIRAGTSYPPDITATALQLPSGLPRRVSTLSRQVTAGAVSPYEKAEAIRKYLAQFPYIEIGTVPPQGADGVDYFISFAKTGNCNNFASAMTVMLRAVGVPARMASGYIVRDWNESAGTITIQARDYHAWPEVYFPGYGWVEFEPTPSDGTGAASPALDTGGAPAEELFEEIPPVFETPGDTAGPVEPPPAAFPVVMLRLTMAAAIISLLAVLSTVVTRQFRRRFHKGDYISDLYFRMCFFASLSGTRPLPSETPAEYCARLAYAFPAQKIAVAMIGRAYQDRRFGPDHLVPVAGKRQLTHSWKLMRRAMLKRIFRFDHAPRHREVGVLSLSNSLTHR